MGRVAMILFVVLGVTLLALFAAWLAPALLAEQATGGLAG
jgi:hypothetical protein